LSRLCAAEKGNETSRPFDSRVERGGVFDFTYRCHMLAQRIAPGVFTSLFYTSLPFVWVR